MSNSSSPSKVSPIRWIPRSVSSVDRHISILLIPLQENFIKKKIKFNSSLFLFLAYGMFFEIAIATISMFFISIQDPILRCSSFLHSLTIEIIDSVSHNVRYRFKFLSHLRFLMHSKDSTLLLDCKSSSSKTWQFLQIIASVSSSMYWHDANRSVVRVLYEKCSNLQ